MLAVSTESPMTRDHDPVEVAVRQAHLPSLIVTLAHLTGRMDLLREEWRPKYLPYRDQQTGGLDEAQQEALRKTAAPLVRQLVESGMSRLPNVSADSLHAMMHFVAGDAIPARYLPLLEEELGLDSKDAAHIPAPTRKVLVVGAGMSGLLAGIELKRAGYDFRIVERNAGVGGTWYSNTYPGCRVDSQNHLYSYSIFPNHDWPHRFSTQPALKAYFDSTLPSFGIGENIQLNTSLVSARFNEETSRWRAVLSSTTGGEETIDVDAVICAVGQLNQPKFPDFPGRTDFAGPQFHSSTWRHDVDLKGKRVAVIGTGASAFQLIPHVAREAAHLTIFQRTAPWVSPTPDYHSEVGEGQQWLFKNLPLYANWYRFWLFWSMAEGVMPALKIDPAWKADDGSISASNQRIRNALIAQMKAQLGDRVDLLDKIIPKSPFGGKRTLRDNGQWVETLKRSNVELVTDKIAQITKDAIVTADGTAHPADVIIYGTGFHASRFLEQTKVYGRDGVEINEMWDGDPKAYLGMTVPEFPNFFCVYGPNTNLVAQGSIIFFSECSVHYIIRCLDMLRETGAKTMEVKRDVHDAYNARVDAENARMAWGMEGVTNWYKSESGRVSQNWPFPLLDYWTLTREPQRSDFIFEGQTARKAAKAG